ncbi:MAG: phosphoribosylaminoimidazolesuccinocarboxamide synthase [Eubacteriales bacterium]|nr:phosphoribosylaminoimidazolesuccinocarboxamide synthase [Eubacteriales bacterium]
MAKLINDTDFIPFPIFIKGKVRNVYDLGNMLLVVSSDRISAFDVVFSELIPNKGSVLNGISAFWFDFTEDIAGNHMITADFTKFPAELANYEDELEGRSMLVKKLQMVEAECVIRGYLEGSGLKDYKKTGEVSGIKLPKGLKQADKLSEPIFTPSTKAKSGHDEAVSFCELKNKIGAELANKLRDTSISLYNKASVHAESKGLILADTKLEFGIENGELVVADEMFTPDSSRFWQKNEYEPGRAQKSFDKQYLREYLETLDWDKTPPAPALPDEIIKKTGEKYIEAFERITGRKFGHAKPDRS